MSSHPDASSAPGAAPAPVNANTPVNANAQVNQTSTGIENIQDEFEHALREEDPNVTLYDLIVQRPTTVIVALCLFGLLLLCASSFQGFDTGKLVDIAREVVDVQPLSARLVNIQDNKIVVSTEAKITLDYNRLGPTFTNTFATAIANKLGFVHMKTDGPVILYFQEDNSSNSATKDAEWHYLLSLHCDEPIKLMLNTDVNTPQLLSAESYLSDAGRTDAIALLVHTALKNKPVNFKAEGTAVLSKYGINFKLGFSLNSTLLIPLQTLDEFAQLSEVLVTQTEHGVQVKALANASLESRSMLNADFPQLKWSVKIPGCSEGSLETLCTATNSPFSISNKSNDIDVYFNSQLEQLPARITTPCYHQVFEGGIQKSPLDQWLSSYFIGRSTVLYFEGVPNATQPQILNQLLTGYEVPYYVYEADEYQKMIQNITIEEVRFDADDPFVGVPLGGAEREMKFTGRALVDVVLPRFLDLSNAQTAVSVRAVRGIVQLFKIINGNDRHPTRRVHFAQVYAEEWVPTLTLANMRGYKINVYFDKLPMDITDSETFTLVSNEVVWNGHSEVLYDAVVDIDFETSVGSFTTQQIHFAGVTDMRSR